MRIVKQTILISVLLCSGFLQGGSAGAAPQKPAGKQSIAWGLIRKSRQKQPEQKPAINSKVSELLDKYAENQGKLKSFICKWETSMELNALLTEPSYTALSGKGRKVRLTEFRCDGRRYSEKFSTWGNIRSVKDFIRKERAPYNSRLWDGQRFFNYVAMTNQPGRLGIYGDVYELPERMQIEHRCNLDGLNVILIRGFYAIDDKRIDTALRKEQTVSIRDKTEKINGSDCYVIYAENPSEKYTIWIDPEHGYNIAQGQVQYKDSDLFLSQENIRFEKIDDVWIIVEAVVKKVQKFRNGDFTDNTSRCKLIEIKINPDHERLSSFLPDDILNGTTVLFQGETWKKTHSHFRAASGRIISRMRAGVRTYFDEQGQVVSYTWRDGKIIDENDSMVADFLKEDVQDSNSDAKQ
ncbi:MAG: hypothetical protein A2168_05830 [Planctomycetes bacterium RBG_13_50_24]|nr:MAG: hypothetical protein A2168_05830 [Planctomycetes bacterium RBG_13_50_24]